MQPAAPMPAGGKGLAKAIRVQTRSRRHTLSKAGGLCHSFEIGLLGHDHAVSKEVGSKIAPEGRPEGRWLTAPYSIYGLRAPGLGRLRARVCVRACA